ELRFELNAFIVAAGVVEGAQHQSLSKLAVVEQVRRGLVVGIDANLESRTAFRVRTASELEFLVDASVEVMRPLRQNRVALAGHRARGVVEQSGVDRCGFHQDRRGEVARIASMK